MRIFITGKQLALSAMFISLSPIKAADLSPRQKTDKDGNIVGMKLAPNGKETFSMRGMKTMGLQNEGGQREERNVYVSVIEPTDIDPLVPYEADGMCWVDHYSMRDGSQTITVICERLVKKA